MKSWSEYTFWQKTKIIFLLLLIIIFTVFATQNWDKVTLEFISWKVSVHLFVALLFSFILGFLISLILSRVKIKSLKKVIHQRNEEIKNLKSGLANKEDIKVISEKVDKLIGGEQGEAESQE